MYAHDTSPLLDKSIHYPVANDPAMMSSPYRSINHDGDDPSSTSSSYYHHLPHRTPTTVTIRPHDSDDLFATPSSELSPSSSSASLPLSQSSSFNNTPSSSSSSSAGGGTASIPALTFTLSNTILGAGVLGIAHAYANSGYFLGLALLLLSASLSLFGLHLLTLSARTLRTSPRLLLHRRARHRTVLHPPHRRRPRRQMLRRRHLLPHRHRGPAAHRAGRHLP